MYSPLIIISIITFTTALKVYIIGWGEPHLFNKLIKVSTDYDIRGGDIIRNAYHILVHVPEIPYMR